MAVVNIKSNNFRLCAFCRHWYDPTNSAIKPRSPRSGHWEYDRKRKEKCLKKGIDMPANAACTDFECKVEK